MRFLAAFALACISPFTAAAQPHGSGGGSPATQQIDWSAVRDETTLLFQRYLRIDNTNPPGNEIAAARFFRDVLAQEGIEATILEKDGGNAHLIARLEAGGTPEGGAIVLLNHMDVVPATHEYWTVDPFAGVIKDGYVWGRGALDMKGTGIAELMAMILLKRHGPPLNRDIVFLATADEEIMGGTDAGEFVRNHGNLIQDAEFLLNEGGSIQTDERGHVLYYGVGVTEKSPFWQRVTAQGTPGHGSRPIPGSATNRLVRGLERLRTWDTEITVTPPVREFFTRFAEVAPPGEAELFRDIDASLTDPAKRQRILDNLFYNAILRNTISITVLEGSPKTNVIPPVARAELDIRLLPGQDPGEFLQMLRRKAGAGGDSLTIEPLEQTWAATASPTNSEMFRAIEATIQQIDPGATVVPYIVAGFTDSHYFREIGIDSYGIGLFKLAPSESARVHGNDERLSIENVGFGTRFMYQILVRAGS